MSLIRPLDPAVPIERQIAREASPVVLVNLSAYSSAAVCTPHRFQKVAAPGIGVA